MDGIHDLGGREGFGPVTVSTRYEGFHEAWEARMFGIVQTMSRAPDWNIDWFRHCRELIDPVDYLRRPYYDQWLQSYAAMMVNSGIATVQEIASGHGREPPADGLRPAMTPAEAVAKLNVSTRFDVRCDRQPAYPVGARVRARTHVGRGHTRLPGYLRGIEGVVGHHHGVHVFADASAGGDDRAEPLYTVAFEAGDIWPEARGRRDVVHADLWESHLDAV